MFPSLSGRVHLFLGDSRRSANQSFRCNFDEYSAQIQRFFAAMCERFFETDFA
jgi:hypothetical protein